MRKVLGRLAMAAVLLAGCTDAGTGGPLPEGHVECPALMKKQAPETQCVAPGQAQRLGASCSSETGACVLVPGKVQPPAVEPDGVVECPVGPVYPDTGQQIVYTPPCSRQRTDSSGAYYVYDGNAVLIGGGTP